jgi:parallel beta-helix repeat protein
VIAVFGPVEENLTQLLHSGLTLNVSSSFPGFPPTRAVDDNLNTSWFSASGNTCPGNCPFFEIIFPQDVTVSRLQMFGNREFANGFDFFAGRFEMFDAISNLLFDSGVVNLPAPNRDITLSTNVAKVRRVRFTATSNESVDPGFAELKVIGSISSRAGIDEDTTTHSLTDCNIGTNNVVIYRGDGSDQCLFPPIPIQIEECKNAKILPGDPALPVIDILATSGDVAGNPKVGPVLINGLSVIGGSVGILVENNGTAKQAGTTLKAIRAENNTADGGFSGEGIEVQGNFNLVSGSTAESNDSGFLVTGKNNTLNSNKALNNIFDGFEIAGTLNLVKGNTATSNSSNGFLITGSGNTLQDNKANKNIDDGFQIDGVGNKLKSNASNQGKSDGSNENGGFEYNILNFPAINQGGNKADNIGIPSSKKCLTFPAVGSCE